MSRPVGTPQLGLTLAAPPPPRLSGLCAQQLELPMLLPFDLRADRDGWTVFEVATNRPAFLDGLPLLLAFVLRTPRTL